MRWSTSMNLWLRGAACSFVKPCPIISLSQRGLGARSVRSDFSTQANRFMLSRVKVSYWSLWQAPHASWSNLVPGLLSLSARWAAVPVWQDTQLTFPCLFPFFSASIPSWHSKHFASLTGASFFGSAVFPCASLAATAPAAVQSANTASRTTNPSACVLFIALLLCLNDPGRRVYHSITSNRYPPGGVFGSPFRHRSHCHFQKLHRGSTGCTLRKPVRGGWGVAGAERGVPPRPGRG